MVFALNLIGKRFGRLIVQSRTKPVWGSGINSVWVCLCDCGGTIEVPTVRLQESKTKSCGCLTIESRFIHSGKVQLTHGMTNTSEYGIWAGMKNRCFNTTDPTYIRYGGRGITVCDSWRNSFEAFYNDMGPRPTDLTLDRINNNGNYEPNNCRWATRIEQSNNREINVFYSFKGQQLTLPQIAREININVRTLRTRLNRGMSEEKAFTSEIFRFPTMSNRVE